MQASSWNTGVSVSVTNIMTTDKDLRIRFICLRDTLFVTFSLLQCRYHLTGFIVFFSRLQILSRLLSSKFLHREIRYVVLFYQCWTVWSHRLVTVVLDYFREKGGAYGSGAKIGGNVFSFFSYRWAEEWFSFL